MSEKPANGHVESGGDEFVRTQTERRVLPWVLAFLPLIALSVLFFYGGTEDAGLEDHPAAVSVGDERAGVYRPAPVPHVTDDQSEPAPATDAVIEELQPTTVSTDEDGPVPDAAEALSPAPGDYRRR